MKTWTSVTEFRATVLRRIEKFIAVRGLSDTTFGQQAVNDGHFVQDLREGVNMTLRRLERAEAFMRAAPDFLAVQAARKLTASLTIHDINDSVTARLKMRAAEHGHSMEEEARRILCAALDGEPPRLSQISLWHCSVPSMASSWTSTRQSSRLRPLNLPKNDLARYQCHFRGHAAGTGVYRAGLAASAADRRTRDDRNQYCGNQVWTGAARARASPCRSRCAFQELRVAGFR